jgi:Protein of unknown function (DUF4089)
MSRKQRRSRSGNSPARLRAGPPGHAPIEDFVDAAALALRLRVDPQSRQAVADNLDLILRVAAAFAEFPLPDEAEPAPVFKA